MEKKSFVFSKKICRKTCTIKKIVVTLQRFFEGADRLMRLMRRKKNEDEEGKAYAPACHAGTPSTLEGELRER